MKHSSKQLNDTIEIALKAGMILKKGFSSNFNVSKKEGVHNLVTEYDLKSEKLIIDFLSKKYPHTSFLSEESSPSSNKSENLWIIDPLDGTVNFAHGIPFFSISIAYFENNEPLLGVIYNPLLDELFTAEKSKGAFFNKKPIQVSSTNELNSAILATGFPYNIDKNPQNCIERFTDIIKKGLPIRRLGSAALDLAYVAAGRFDGFWETNLGPWDYAAGTLLIEEAKGKITTWEGNDVEVQKSKTILATNKLIHQELTDILKQSFQHTEK